MPSSNKSPSHHSETGELLKLFSLINTPVNCQQLPSIHLTQLPAATSRHQKSFQWPVPQLKSRAGAGGGASHQSKETSALELFSSRYHNNRQLSAHTCHKHLKDLFASLVKHRLCCNDWIEYAPPENIFRVLVCLRIYLRDKSYQMEFYDIGAVKVLAQHLQKATDSYLFYGDGAFVLDILKEMTNIFQKISGVVEQRDWVIVSGAHKSLVLLLSANDVIVLHCTLHALSSLAQSKQPRIQIGELNSVESLLRIMQDYDNVSKKLAANLLRILCADSQPREMIKIYDGIPLLLSLLHSDHVKLLWNVVWCVVQLAEDQDASNDIRNMGGIPLLLALLHDRPFNNSDQFTPVTSASSSQGRLPANNAAYNPAVNSQSEEECKAAVGKIKKRKRKSKGGDDMEHVYSLKSAVCAALTELVLNDTNAQQIVQANGIYSIGRLILPHDKSDKKSTETLQKNAFRALRFLFSMERNRQLFKRLFPPELYEMFIDVRHYVRDLGKYQSLVDKINILQRETIEEIQENILATNHHKSPTKFIGDYAVLEILGSGAFGTVYKVKKKSAGQSFLAMKELNVAVSGKNSKERDASMGEMMNELNIVKEQLKHPNVVRYHKTFVEDHKLYIVMELIEGAPLGEHFNSLKEKGEKFPELRVWNIFIQMVLALRYLHKDKGILHRDLTPNNIMLGEGDRVTITDFGLAKQKRKDCSKMTSVVGTMLYNCPELVQNLPYGDKADVWAIGCILYQMCMLKPPFFGNNMLSLVKKIVEAEYEPIPDSEYSEKMKITVRSCITADPDERPDIVGVAAVISDVMLVHMDALRLQQISMEKKLERERKRTERHYYEANKNMQNYHRLFLVSQERYDKLLASSGGASSLKDGEFSDSNSIFSDLESTDGGSGRHGDSRPGSGTRPGSSDYSRRHAAGSGSRCRGDASDFARRAVAAAKSDNVATVTSTRSDDDDNNNDKGWVSDDEGSSSQSSSRGSSAGSVKSTEMSGTLKAADDVDEVTTVVVPMKPPVTPRKRNNQKQQSKWEQELTVDIPESAKSSYRDSGLDSGDPSPNASSPPSTGESVTTVTTRIPTIQRSISTNTLESPTTQRRNPASSKPRPSSANTATLTISPRKVRQISDPILQLLNQLHKIIYICQLPPSLCHNPRRRAIEMFKRGLFTTQSSSLNLKNELKKLLTGCQDLIDLNSVGAGAAAGGLIESPLASRQFSRQTSRETSDDSDIGLTYEQMQAVIESVLVECGYYDMSPMVRNKGALALTGPLGGAHSVDQARRKVPFDVP